MYVYLLAQETVSVISPDVYEWVEGQDDAGSMLFSINKLIDSLCAQLDVETIRPTGHSVQTLNYAYSSMLSHIVGGEGDGYPTLTMLKCKHKFYVLVEIENVYKNFDDTTYIRTSTIFQ